MPREKDRSKFVELAEKRVLRTIRDLRLIGNLSNRSNYYYKDNDVKKIIKVLQDELNDLKARFERQGESENVCFKLDD